MIEHGYMFIFQCTWGIIQTLMGAVVFLIHWKCPHERYKGCINTKWDSKGGLSLGLFIFTPKDDVEDAEKIRVHEYGHCVQSVVTGPFYLLIGIISIIWARLPFFVKMRKEKGIPYTSCFVESWASRWGRLATGKEAI